MRSFQKFLLVVHVYVPLGKNLYKTANNQTWMLVLRCRIIYFFLSRSLLSHHIPERQLKTNPKSKLQNPDQKARLPWGKRKSFVPKGLPLILMNKLGCLPHVFFMCFPVIKAALFFSVRFIGFPITSQNAKKEKSREFPLGGPSPCGKQD